MAAESVEYIFNFKILKIFFFIIFLLLLPISIFCFCASIQDNNLSNLDRNELHYEELTYESYTYISDSKLLDYCTIRVSEYERPFHSVLLTEKDVSNLVAGEKIGIYYTDDNLIAELSSESDTLVSFDEFVKYYHSGHIGSLCLAIIILGLAIIALLFLLLLKPNSFGALIIKYKIAGNVIEIYNTYSICSLVINKKVVDRFFGKTKRMFTLRGELSIGDATIPIEARMGDIHMNLYCNGEKVATKFMGLTI